MPILLQAGMEREAMVVLCREVHRQLKLVVLSVGIVLPYCTLIWRVILSPRCRGTRSSID